MTKETCSMVGKRFGHWTVEELDRVDEYGLSYWVCKCDCGTVRSVRHNSLTSGRSSSCGCITRIQTEEKLIGQRFGRLTVLAYDHRDNQGKTCWLCECDCGNKTVVAGYALTRGQTKSCGCLVSERMIEYNTTHGMCGTRVHGIWLGMWKRCRSNYPTTHNNYGGRGISVCDEWADFEVFYEWAMNNGYTDELTIDRIDNDLGYCPDNCRWVDMVTQSNNKRTNRYITYCNERHTIADWARLFGIDYELLRQRINRNYISDFAEYFGVIDANWFEG